MAAGFTQLVVYRFTGPRVSWQGELDEQEVAALLASFSSFFKLLYRVPLAPAGEVLARDVVLFMGSGGSAQQQQQVVLVSHSPIVTPPPQQQQQQQHDTDPLQALPYAESITLHLVRLSDGVRLCGSRFEGELVDLSGRPGTLGVVAHEDLIAVLALRRQVIHLLQVVRGGEEVVLVRSLGPHVNEDDELALRTAAEAEERWLRAWRAEREAGTWAGLPGLQGPLAALAAPDEAQAPPLPALRRSINGDLVRGDLSGAPAPSSAPAAAQQQQQQPPGNPAGPSLPAAATNPAATSGGLLVPPGASAVEASAPVAGQRGPDGTASGGRTGSLSLQHQAAATADPAGSPAGSAGQARGQTSAPQAQAASTDVGGAQAVGLRLRTGGAASVVAHGSVAAGGGGLVGSGSAGGPGASLMAHSRDVRAGPGQRGSGGVEAAGIVGQGSAGRPNSGGSEAAADASPGPALPPPVAVLYPPAPHVHRMPGAGAALPQAGHRGSRAGAGIGPADVAAAAAHQAAVRRQIRQQQYDQLALQTGPAQPERRAPPAGGGGRSAAAAGATVGALPRQPVMQQGLEQAAGMDAEARGSRQLQGGPRAGLAGGLRGPRTQAAAAARPQSQPPGGPREPAHAHFQQARPPHHFAPSLRYSQYQYRQHPHQQRGGATAAAAGPSHPQGHPQYLHAPTAAGGAQAGGSRAFLDPAGPGGGGFGAVGAGGGSAPVTGIRQRLLAHLYGGCMRQHANNPRRLQRELLPLFRMMDTYRSLVMRKVFLLDRTRLLIDMRTPAGADLGTSALGGGSGAAPAGGPGMLPSQYFLLFDLESTNVISFRASPGDKVIEKFIRETTSREPWAESLQLWDRYTYDAVLQGTRLKLRNRSAGPMPGVGPQGPGAGLGSGPGPGLAGGYPVVDPGHPGVLSVTERASCANKLMQLMPPVSGSCGLSSCPYLDPTLFSYDDRVISPYIRTRPCLEQPISFRPRTRPDRAGFRWDPGPYEAMVVRDRRLARNVTHLFHPDAPFLLAVFSVFQQTSLNINFRT